MNIVITGSLGHIGRPLTETLVQGGHAVTVISSKADRAAEIETLGAKAAIGSLEDAGFLTQAFQGADAAFLMVPPNFGENDQLAYYNRQARLYADALQAAGVRRAVYLSSYGADLDSDTGLILGSHFGELMLAEVPGLELVRLRAGFFYYNLLPYIPVIKQAGKMFTNLGSETKLLFVHPADIAAAAAEELTRADVVPMRYVVSDDRSPLDAARLIGQAIGKPEVEWITVPDEQVLANLQRVMLPGYAAGLVELNRANREGRLRADFDRNPPATFGPTKLEDYMPEFVAAYKAGEAAGH